MLKLEKLKGKYKIEYWGQISYFLTPFKINGKVDAIAELAAGITGLVKNVAAKRKAFEFPTRWVA